MSRAKLLLTMLFMVVGLSVVPAFSQTGVINLEDPVAPVAEAAKTYMVANPLDMVAAPTRYLHKNVKVRAKFDKFSTLGLDYSPAMRSSEEYISFLIQRPDVKDHNIPLSEMKIFMKRADAEKHIELDSGDEVEFSGKVFSNALGDVWMDVDKFTVLTIKKKTAETKK